MQKRFFSVAGTCSIEPYSSLKTNGIQQPKWRSRLQEDKFHSFSHRINSEIVPYSSLNVLIIRTIPMQPHTILLTPHLQQGRGWNGEVQGTMTTNARSTGQRRKILSLSPSAELNTQAFRGTHYILNISSGLFFLWKRLSRVNRPKSQLILLVVRAWSLSGVCIRIPPVTKKSLGFRRIVSQVCFQVSS